VMRHIVLLRQPFRASAVLGAEKVIGFYDGKAMLDPGTAGLMFGHLNVCSVRLFRFGERDSREENGGCHETLSESYQIYTALFLEVKMSRGWYRSGAVENKVLRMIKTCGSYYRTQVQWRMAWNAIRRGWKWMIDRGVLPAHDEMLLSVGRRAEALSVYKRCSQVLSSVLGINPQKKQKLYQGTETLKVPG